MSGTDITRLLEAIQKKIDAVDSSASSGDLLRLLSSVRQAGTGSLLSYDNQSQIPNLLDGTPDPGMIAYTLDSDKLYFQKGSWVGKELPITPFQGSNFGYASGGSSGTNVIDKFSFASDGDASNVGNLTTGRFNVAGQSSATYGYNSGGSGVPSSNAINKFPFASDFSGSTTNVGDLTVAKYNSAGQSSIGNGFGYTTASEGSPSVTYNVIDKFSFATDGDATDVGDMSIHRWELTGQSSTTDGYASGGVPSTYGNTIDKFSFTTDGDATDVGDLSFGRRPWSGQSSTTHGYSSGGFSPAGRVDIIDKFPFSTDANATDVGDLTVGKNANSGQSSTAHGYSSGGYDTGVSNIIEKFPFASDGNATDVGDLTVAGYGAAGQQY